MNNSVSIQSIDINRLRCCVKSLIQALQIANSYCENNPGITLIRQNLHELKNIIKTIDDK